jgi:hypothetical protein
MVEVARRIAGAMVGIWWCGLGGGSVIEGEESKGEKKFRAIQAQKKPHAGNWQAVPRAHGRRDCNSERANRGFGPRAAPKKHHCEPTAASCFQVHVSRGHLPWLLGEFPNFHFSVACPLVFAKLGCYTYIHGVSGMFSSQFLSRAGSNPQFGDT